MTTGEFLQRNTTQLAVAGIETARLDCLILLEDTLKMNRASLLAHSEQEISEPQQKLLANQITRRESHEPLAYIRGMAAFFGRNFVVNEHVLVPRPETEIMIEMLKKLALPKDAQLVDIGTGSGCIGVTAALELPLAHVTLTDIDPAALETARLNAGQLGAHVKTYSGNLLAGWHQPVNVILANLPYVPEAFPINKAAAHEPELALFAGTDGLRDYKTLWQQVAELSVPPEYVLTESLPMQHHALAQLARSSNYALEKTDGFIQLFQHI